MRVDVGALHRELVLRLGGPAADADGWRQLQIGPNPRNAVQLGRQLADYLIGGEPFAARLQPDADAALIHGAPAYRRHEVGDVGIAPPKVRDDELMVPRVLVRAAFPRLRRSLDLARGF